MEPSAERRLEDCGPSSQRRPRTPVLPTGTVTFLFTDIEGPTTLLNASATAGTRRSWRNTGVFSGRHSQKGTVRRLTRKVMRSWWHSHGPETLSGLLWRRNARSRPTPGRTARRSACGWGCIPANLSAKQEATSGLTFGEGTCSLPDCVYPQIPFLVPRLEHPSW